MTGESVAGSRDTGELALLWSAFLAGPFAWTFNQGVGYAVMKGVCAGADRPVLWLIAALALGVTAAGAWIGWRHAQRASATAVDGGGGVNDRNYFIAVLAVALNVLIGLLIVASAIPQFLLSPCE